MPGAEINPYAMVIYFRVAYSPTFLHHTLEKLPLMAGIKNRTHESGSFQILNKQYYELHKNMAGIRLDEEWPQMSLLTYGTRQNAGASRAWAVSGILGGSQAAISFRSSDPIKLVPQVTGLTRNHFNG